MNCGKAQNNKHYSPKHKEVDLCSNQCVFVTQTRAILPLVTCPCPPLSHPPLSSHLPGQVGFYHLQPVQWWEGERGHEEGVLERE